MAIDEDKKEPHIIEDDDDDFEFDNENSSLDTDLEDEDSDFSLTDTEAEIEDHEDTEAEIEPSKQEKVQAEEEFVEAVADASPKPIGTQDLTLPLVIEIGRIHMTIEKLLQLQKGNILELDVRPEEGVDLVLHGRCVGKGELYKIGHVLGVRVTEIGS